MHLRIVNLRPVVENSAGNINRHITNDDNPHQRVNQDIFNENLPKGEVNRTGFNLG